MKLSELLRQSEILGQACDLETDITDICTDSRKAGPGQVFVAIQGYATDGNLYIRDALAKGVAAVVTQSVPQGDIPYVQVGDARRALAEMSACFFGQPQKQLKLIGVTGTNGKTTVTNLIRAIIEGTGQRCGLIGTNEIVIPGLKAIPADRTTPESYDVFKYLAQMRDKKCSYAVMEVSSHALMLERVHGLAFEAGVFTNLSQDHLDFHQTMAAYAAAKARLFDHCKTAIVNFDDPAAASMLAGKTCRQLTYSAKDNAADLVAKNIKLGAERVEFEAVTRGGINRISLGVPGLFSVYNALAAVGCALALELPNALEASAQGLAAVRGIPGRAEVVPVEADFTVIIDYAHSPDSMENILKAVRGFAKGRVIGLFGCGGDRDKTKRPLMGRAGALYSDVCIITSDNPRTENPRAIIDDIIPGTFGATTPTHIIPDRRQAIAFALRIADPGDVVVLMGKGHETYQEIEGKKHHLDEREVVAEYFKNQG